MDQGNHAGHRVRLRARYLQEGLDGFEPHEMLELLLTYAIPRVNTNPIAHRLIEHFGSLHGVLEANPEELEQVTGVGASAATLISMLVPLFRAYEREKSRPRKKIGTYEELTAYCRSLFLGATAEKFYLLSLDAQLKLKSTKLLFSGTPSEVPVNSRMIVQELIRQNATGAVITHNHPSGSSRPSQEDVRITQDLYSLLQGMGIRLYDHIIVSGAEIYSFSRGGYLPCGGENAAGSQEPLAADRPQRTLPVRKTNR